MSLKVLYLMRTGYIEVKQSLCCNSYLLVVMKCYVTFGLFLSITVTVQSQCESFSFVYLVNVNTYSLLV